MWRNGRRCVFCLATILTLKQGRSAETKAPDFFDPALLAADRHQANSNICQVALKRLTLA